MVGEDVDDGFHDHVAHVVILIHPPANAAGGIRPRAEPRRCLRRPRRPPRLQQHALEHGCAVALKQSEHLHLVNLELIVKVSVLFALCLVEDDTRQAGDKRLLFAEVKWSCWQGIDSDRQRAGVTLPSAAPDTASVSKPKLWVKKIWHDSRVVMLLTS